MKKKKCIKAWGGFILFCFYMQLPAIGNFLRALLEPLLLSLLYFLFLNIKFLGRGKGGWGQADLKRICEYKMLYLGGGGWLFRIDQQILCDMPHFFRLFVFSFFLSAPLNQITVPLYIYFFFYTLFFFSSVSHDKPWHFLLFSTVSIREIFGPRERGVFLSFSV